MDTSCFSKLGTVKLSDFWRGLIIAVITAILTVIYQSVSTGTLKFDWQVIVTTGLTAGIAYILKNLSTGANGKLLTNAAPPLQPGQKPDILSGPLPPDVRGG